MVDKGIRLNNPGNIEHGQPWMGLSEVQSDPRFCQFVAPQYGIRAIHIILQTYQNKYGLKSVSDIINKWAPPNENDTASYIKDVSFHCGVGPDDQVFVMEPQAAYYLVTAIIAHEDSNYHYEEDVIWMGLELAGVNR